MQGHIARRESKDRKGKKKILWYVVVDAGRDAKGKRRQKWHGSFRTRREAEAARAKIVSDLNAGTYAEPPASPSVSTSPLPGCRQRAPV